MFCMQVLSSSGGFGFFLFLASGFLWLFRSLLKSMFVCVYNIYSLL